MTTAREILGLDRRDGWETMPSVYFLRRDKAIPGTDIQGGDLLAAIVHSWVSEAAEYVPVAVVPYALWNDDMSSSPWTRANFDVLRETYGAELICETYSYPFGAGLLVPLDSELSDGLAEVLAHLFEPDGCPVLDSDRTYAIEADIFREAWSADGWCIADLRGEVETTLEDEALATLAVEAARELEIWPMYETAESMAYDRHDWARLVSAVAARVDAARAAK